MVGSWTVNTVSPGRLSTMTRPPWAATTASTMARPSPVLPAVRGAGLAPRANRSKTSRQQLGRDARAVVDDVEPARRPPVAGRR